MKRNVLSATVRVSLISAAVLAGLCLPRVFGESPTTEPAGPATQPMSDAAPAPDVPAAKAKVSPEAQTELAAVTAAYNKVTSLELNGSIDVVSDIDGKADKQSTPFTSTFQAPTKFRHAIKDDLIVGCTGEKSYLYSTARNIYAQSDAPKTKENFTKQPSRQSQALSQQNPGLLLALVGDAGQSLIDNATDVSKAADEKVGDQSYTALLIKSAAADQTVLIDPATHLVHAIRIDLSKGLIAEGAPNVKSATATFNYSTVTANGEMKPTAFAWAPPEGAKDAATAAPQGEGGEATAMVGKPAADFSLEGLDGKKISLADLKGQAFILDFWATWCGPCKMSLPHLDKLYQDKKAAGLKVFAVNLEEDKKTVQDFVDSTKLGIPILLDSDGKIGGAYSANAIPETVLIGKDGTVKKVIVGYDESDALQKAIEAELAAK